jgi:uncharacterized alkaline shock family protein YloU
MSSTTQPNKEVLIDDVIETATQATMECYGVVDMSTHHTLRAGIASFLQPTTFSRGVFVKRSKDGLVVDIFIILAYGVKITEVVNEVQKKVHFVLEKKYKEKIESINIYVDDIRKV